MKKKFIKIFALLIAMVFSMFPSRTFSMIKNENASEQKTDAIGSKNAGSDTVQNKDANNLRRINKIASIEGTLPPRKISSGAYLTLGFIAPAGFLLGADISIGWKIVRFLSLHTKIGAGAVQKKAGTSNTLIHADVLLPVRMAICSHSPRICPGLDFYISVVPGIGYGMTIRNKVSNESTKILNYSINGILGLALESIRTYGNMDAGVRFGASMYIDFLKEQDGEAWTPSLLFELGIVVRWGKTS